MQYAVGVRQNNTRLTWTKKIGSGSGSGPRQYACTAQDHPACVHSASVFHGNPFIDILHDMSSSTRNKTTKYCGKRRLRSGVVGGTKEKKRPNQRGV